jgi:hypothetical protein
MAERRATYDKRGVGPRRGAVAQVSTGSSRGAGQSSRKAQGHLRFAFGSFTSREFPRIKISR